MKDSADLARLLAFHLCAGVDETLEDRPCDRTAFAAPSRPVTIANEDARALARSCRSLEEIKAALARFEGCALKRTATTTVVGRGNPAARLMLVGEAPGADEDRQGRPFVGAAGQLLDRMLAAIGLDENSVYITNVVPWRPPGNRSPTAEEVAQCLPFLERQVELVAPLLLVLLGNIAVRAVLERSEGITKLRGRWFDYGTPALARPIPAFALFHPAYLLRQPAQKRQAWADLLELKARFRTALAAIP
jgi:DNA polymerase